MVPKRMGKLESDPSGEPMGHRVNYSASHSNQQWRESHTHYLTTIEYCVCQQYMTSAVRRHTFFQQSTHRPSNPHTHTPIYTR